MEPYADLLTPRCPAVTPYPPTYPNNCPRLPYSLPSLPHTSPQPPKPNKTKLTSKHIIATPAGQSRYCPWRSLSRREPSFGHKRLEESFSCPL
ncbi:hypothetical protein E2C01_038105 [Portunus trituberculatus]|uniref:Uncharacterized protein n=1 Tax=Portunus trituberculatus TaxID=210409 RepID=A0A5B7FDA1_PORTR|nr:hypothetical protein [Portunus trituberculatus]